MSSEANIVVEARRVVDAATERGVLMRTIGGVAISLHSGDDGVHPAFRREYRDIDVVTPRKAGREAVKVLAELGYEPNERFNAMNGGRRMVVYDMQRGRQLDVFVGEFEMCHRLPIASRLELEPQTVPLAELLLTKLQVVKVNKKDVQDICAILVDHHVSDDDHEAVNARYIAQLLSSDWGLWRTSKGTIETTKSQLDSFALSDTERGLIEDRLNRLWERIESEPKSLRWKGRAKVGDRTVWYQDPEEIGHRALADRE